MNAQKTILALYREQRSLPFAWGAADCLCWCADCAAALTGSDPARHLRGRYKTALGARRIIEANEWRDLAGVARSLFAEIPVAQARTGDWAFIVNADGTDTLGVVVGHMIAAKTERAGLGQVPLTRAQAAFRVE